MKKSFKTYAIAWAVMFVLFNVICFATPNETEEYIKFGGAFWSGYAFITIAFIGQLLCAYKAFKAENITKFFYNLPIITISFTGLILTLIFGGACMIIPGLPNWVGIIVCMIILAFCAVSVIKAGAAAEVVEQIDKKTAEKTSFIKSMTVKCENITALAKSDEIKKECKKVCEAVRYSDPVSADELAETEAEIERKLDEFKNAVEDDNADKVKVLTTKLITLIADRAFLCRSVKR